MFGLGPSEPAKKSLKLFQEKNIKKIVELGAGLGRDAIFFATNNIINFYIFLKRLLPIINLDL